MNARKIVPALHNENLGKVICQFCLLFCNQKMSIQVSKQPRLRFLTKRLGLFDVFKRD